MDYPMTNNDRTGRANERVDVLSTDADLITEVSPRTEVYDEVRERVVDEYIDQVDDVVGDARSAIRIESVQLGPASWTVIASIRGVALEYQLESDSEIAGHVTDYSRACIDDRFGLLDADSDDMVFKSITLKPGTWFVEGVLLDSGYSEDSNE